ncbi:UNVERIFIED_CONTAM: hypothetical protein FKN15_006298 [Acipenser sinensis]
MTAPQILQLFTSVAMLITVIVTFVLIAVVIMYSAVSPTQNVQKMLKAGDVLTVIGVCRSFKEERGLFPVIYINLMVAKLVVMTADVITTCRGTFQKNKPLLVYYVPLDGNVGSAPRYHPRAVKRVPSADRFFSHCRLTMQPPRATASEDNAALGSLQASLQAPVKTTGVTGARQTMVHSVLCGPKERTSPSTIKLGTCAVLQVHLLSPVCQ